MIYYLVIFDNSDVEHLFTNIVNVKNYEDRIVKIEFYFTMKQPKNNTVKSYLTTGYIVKSELV